MTFSPTLPYPMALWDEPSIAAGSTALTRLVPWKRTDGFWVLLPVGTVPPAGATLGAMVRTSGYSTLTTSTTTGLSITRGPAGFVFFY